MNDWVDRLAAAQQLEMQGRAGRAAGVADEADQVALLYAHARRDPEGERRKVAVDGRELVFVLDLDPVAVAAVRCRAAHDAVGRCKDGRTRFSQKIDSLVHDEGCWRRHGAGRGTLRW